MGGTGAPLHLFSNNSRLTLSKPGVGPRQHVWDMPNDTGSQQTICDLSFHAGFHVERCCLGCSLGCKRLFGIGVAPDTSTHHAIVRCSGPET